MQPSTRFPVWSMHGLPERAWSLLAEALDAPRSAMSMGMLGTFSAAGEPRLWRQGLGGVDPESRELHGRGALDMPALVNLAVNPRAVWVCSDPRARVQAVFAGSLQASGTNWRLCVDALSVAGRHSDGHRYSQQWTYEMAACPLPTEPVSVAQAG